jgi:hypothetical protein
LIQLPGLIRLLIFTIAGEFLGVDRWYSVLSKAFVFFYEDLA